MTCPHCGSDDIDPGATGLDLCTHCGGLSRDGKPLDRRHAFRTFDAPVIREDLKFLPTVGITVAAVMVEGVNYVAFHFITEDHQVLPPILLPVEQARDIRSLVDDAMAALDRGTN